MEADEPVFVGESDVKESHFGGEKLKPTADYQAVTQARMTDHKKIMEAITGLIERYLRHESILLKDFEAVDKMMESYYKEYAKKNPRAKPFDSSLAAWMIHEQMFLGGTEFASGGTPGYFWDLIEDECNGGEPVAERHFTHCAALFGMW